ncbi:MAG: lytic transglycosylase domain-containing protein [Burkholderiales bacterium]|nr:lytic transglycosylase domain-containing protein [Burkholderiales bacterium]
MVPKALFLLAFLCADAHADIYAFTDENGVPNFTDSPSDPRYKLFLKTERKAESGTKYARQIQSAASIYRIDAALLDAVIATESDYNSKAVSRRGALGLMQLMPATARRYGVADAFDPEQNIRAGSQHLRKLLTRYGDNLPLALAAYNAGENTVLKYGETIPPYRETTQYVSRVMDRYQRERF